MHDLDYTGSQGTANGYGDHRLQRGRPLHDHAATRSRARPPTTSSPPPRSTSGRPQHVPRPQPARQPRRPPGPLADLRRRRPTSPSPTTSPATPKPRRACSSRRAPSRTWWSKTTSSTTTPRLHLPDLPVDGLVFRHNTVVGSHWGCLFRDLASSAAGSGYQVDHNVFADTGRRLRHLHRGPGRQLGHLRLQRLRGRLGRRAPTR